MTFTDDEHIAIYMALHVSQLRRLPKLIVDAWGIGQLLVEARRSAPAWPPEDRIDAIGHNGNNGEHYIIEREPGPSPFGGRRTDRSRA